MIQKFTNDPSVHDLLNNYVLVGEKEESYLDDEFGVVCRLNYFKNSNLAKVECVDKKSNNIYEAYNMEINATYGNRLISVRKKDRELVVNVKERGFKIPSKSEEEKNRKELDEKINAIIDRKK